MSWWRSSKSNRLDEPGRPHARRRTLARAKNARRLDEFGERVGGPARPDDPAVVLLRLAWRYRHELGPFYVLLVLATIAGIGNMYAPALRLLALPLSAAVTAALWRWKTDRTVERAYVLAIGVAATLWTMVAWWASSGHDWLVVIGLAGAVAAGIPHWLHYRPRGKVTVRRGAARAIRRELRKIVKGLAGADRIHEARGLAHPAR